MSKEEFTQMLQLIKRYITTEMDQWEMWKFDTDRSRMYIDISMIPSQEGCEDAYTDLNHLLEEN
ncbi:hypothetical protein [Zooshikella ganghwensis]|nr:hypothetical protein [Zooshikella ganghwensis]